MTPEQIVWLIAGLFAGAATVVSAYELYLHIANYNQPTVQRLIIRIILMVPIYAVDSFMSLVLKDTAIYWDTARNCYEAFVVYSFFTLLLTLVGGANELGAALLNTPKRRHLFPLCKLPAFQPGPTFVRQCQRGTLQFVLVKILTTLCSFILHFFGLYGEGHLTPHRGYLYIVVIDNISITVAMYCLLLFYTVCKEDLKPFRPVPKFLVVKAVIFFSFWQGVIVAILVHFDVIDGLGEWTQRDVATALQNFMICVEMLGAAFAHRWAFGAKEFKTDKSTSVLRNLRHVISPGDVASETVALFAPAPLLPVRRTREPEGLLHAKPLKDITVKEQDYGTL